jgi:hypothetical protein
LVVLENLTKGLRQSEDDKTIKGNPKINFRFENENCGNSIEKSELFVEVS